MINHKCVNCGKIYPNLSEEILIGCICGSKLFYFVKSKNKKDKPQIGKNNSKMNAKINNIDAKNIFENDDGEFLYEYDEENNEIMIFDIESISVKGNGKYDINLEGLMNHNGLIYKYDDGKYSIDLDNTIKRFKNKSVKL